MLKFSYCEVAWQYHILYKRYYTTSTNPNPYQYIYLELNYGDSFMRRKSFLHLIVLYIFSVCLISWTINSIASRNETTLINAKKRSVTTKKEANSIQFLYDSLQLDTKGLSKDAFYYAINGFEKMKQEGIINNDSVLTIIDFDQPSYKKRMYVIDVRNYKILFHTLVAHGKNTGKELAESFSNVNKSNKSSLGFYITNVTYYGSKGYSLKLIGLEEGLNSNALRRAIVVHGAPYVNESYIDTQGYIGRSLGCPAVPQRLSKPIIQTIKDGSCFFIYNKTYKPSPRFQIG